MVTELGSEAAIHDVIVEASDWMTALTMGRGRIGERGGVPPGAMCSVSPEGIVSLMDAVTRKRYRLEPTASLPSAPPPSKPASIPPPATVNVKVSKRTVAFDAASLGLKQVVGVGVNASVAAAPAPPVAPAASPASAPPVAAPAPSAPASVAPAATNGTRQSGTNVPRPVSVPAPAPSSTSSPKSSEAAKKVPKHTVAYIAAPTPGGVAVAVGAEPVTEKTATLTAREAAAQAPVVVPTTSGPIAAPSMPPAAPSVPPATPSMPSATPSMPPAGASVAPPAPSRPPPAVVVGDLAEQT